MRKKILYLYLASILVISCLVGCKDNESKVQLNEAAIGTNDVTVPPTITKSLEQKNDEEKLDIDEETKENNQNKVLEDECDDNPKPCD